MNQELRVEDVAKEFNYSKFYFSREFKRLIGVTPQEYLMALKIERSLKTLLQQRQSILKSQLAAGYLSSGTFSTTFAKNTGVSPRNYQQGLLSFFDEGKRYEDSPNLSAHYQKVFSADLATNKCRVVLNLPTDFEVGLIFVGLFHRPIPNHRPIIEVALRDQQSYKFTRIPAGSYYLMTFAVKKSNNPLDYFLVSNSLRAQHSKPLSFPADETVSVVLTLREAQVKDPPIVFNFLKLLRDILVRAKS